MTFLNQLKTQAKALQNQQTQVVDSRKKMLRDRELLAKLIVDEASRFA